LGIAGKPEGMSGEKAPVLWAQGRTEEVLQYVAQDVRIALQIACVCDKKRRFTWVTGRGVKKSFDLPRGRLPVCEAMSLPQADTSWMSQPIPRSQFTEWLGQRR
jgi:hypothetical protein